MMTACSGTQNDIKSTASAIPAESIPPTTAAPEPVQENKSQNRYPQFVIPAEGDEQIWNAEKQKVHFTPITDPMPEEEIGKWIRAAVHGDEAGMFILGMIYKINHDYHNDSKTFPIDISKYIEKLVIEVKYEDIYTSHINFEEFLHWVIKLEEENSVFADLLKSPTLIYQIPASLSCPKDTYAAVLNWLEEAAKRGYPDAEYLLAIIYLNGLNVDVDREKGIELMRRAALHNLNVAQYNLAMMYELGIHMPSNDQDKYDANSTVSNFWLKQAAAERNKSAKLILALKELDTRSNAQRKGKVFGDEQDIQLMNEFDIDVNEEPPAGDRQDVHIWNLLLRHGDFKETCIYRYDMGELHTSYDYPEAPSTDGCFNAYWNDDISRYWDAYDENDNCGEEGGIACSAFDEDNLDPEFMEACRIANLIEEREGDSLPYSIDYALDNLWLNRSAENETHAASRHLRALTLAGKGCRGTVTEGDPLTIAQQFIESDMNDDNRAKKHLQLANFYYVDKEDLKTSFDYYKTSMREGDPQAKHRFFYFLEWFNLDKLLYKIGLKDPDLQAYYWLTEEIGGTCAQKEAQNTALRIINYLDHKYPAPSPIEIESKLKWYYRVIQQQFSDERSYPFDIHIPVYQFYKLAEQNENLLPNIRINKDFLDDWARHIIELGYSDDYMRGDSIYINAKERIAKNPVIPGFAEAVFRQIQLEKGKDLQNFFAITKVKDPYINDKLTRKELDNYYKDSITKAQTAIIALLLAQNVSPDLELVRNTFFHVAIEQPRDPEFMKQCEANSPVCEELRHSTLGMTPEAYHYDDDDAQSFPSQKIFRRELFFIWYLRQFPYAAEDLYKELGQTEKWKTYMNEAQKLIQSNEAIRNALDFDPRLRMQKLPEIDFSKVPDLP